MNTRMSLGILAATSLLAAHSAPLSALPQPHRPLRIRYIGNGHWRGDGIIPTTENRQQRRARERREKKHQ